MAEKPLVVITGITGYLGSETCRVFLKDGSYRVRGTVRSKSNEAKIKPVRDGLGDELFNQLELVEADLNDEDSLVNACDGATYLVHTASPFHFKGDCVGPAVAGTMAAMKACTKHGVKKIIMTSSCVAIQCPAATDKPPQGTPYDETCWSNPDRPEGLNDYFKSKTLAEKAAWDYQSANPSFDMVTINPTFIMGPSICSGDGFSENWMKAVLNGSKAEVPKGGMAFVDVRDVALAHLKGLQVPEAANKRFILAQDRALNRDVYAWLAELNEKGAKVPSKREEAPDPTEFDLLSNKSSKEVLGIEYTPLKKTMMDHAEALLLAGGIGN